MGDARRGTWDGPPIAHYNVAEDFVNVSAGPRSDLPAHGFNGPVGRCVSVIMAAGFSATAPEPDVLAARQMLAAQYGITLA